MGNDSGVVARILGDSSDILRREIDAHILEILSRRHYDIVTDSDIIQFEVVASLEEITGDNTSVALDAVILEVSGAEYIVGTASLQAHTILTRIVDIEIECATPHH